MMKSMPPDSASPSDAGATAAPGDQLAAERSITVPRRRWRSAPATAPGEVVYAIGDIHGRLDLFADLIERIGADPARRPNDRRNRIVVLGDVIDRGPDSAALLETLMAAEQTMSGFEVLLGNHEAALLDSLAGDRAAQDMWVSFGGQATLDSFGITCRGEDEAPAAFAGRLAQALGPDLIDWLEERPTFTRSGDFFFCHAGVRPGVQLDRQGRDDLLWIREPFLSSNRYNGGVVVHGHTVVAAPEVRANRIAIDTGAYRTGVLTAIALDGDQARLIQTRA